MNLLYAVNSNGNGHRVHRSILKPLLAGHTIYEDWYEQPRLVVEAGSLKLAKSLLSTLTYPHETIIKSLFTFFKTRHIDTVITDMEPIAAQAAHIYGLPVIAVDAQMCTLARAGSPPLKTTAEKLSGYLYLKRLEKLASWINKGIDISLWSHNGPLIRPALLDRTKITNTGGYISYHHGDKLINSQEHWDNILLNATHVTCNAGHTLLAECLWLRKPTQITPLRNHYEQILNAHMFHTFNSSTITPSNHTTALTIQSLLR